MLAWRFGVAAALAFTGGVAAAAAPPDAIVVQGERQRAQIDSFVDQLRPTFGSYQLGKFLQPVCPEVAGLDGAQNLDVADRMRRVAEAAEIEVGPSGCTTNVLLLVVKDKPGAMKALARTRPDLVAGVSPTEFRQMTLAPTGAAAWQVVDLIGTDGMHLSATGMKTGKQVEQEAHRSVQTVGSPSRVRELSVPQFLASVVIVESDVARDVTTTQLADYALMRALTGSRETDAAPKQSILNLVNADRTGTPAPLSATWWDVAFLKSLYATTNAVEASAQRDAIARRMAGELQKLPTQER